MFFNLNFELTFVKKKQNLLNSVFANLQWGRVEEFPLITSLRR